MNDGRVEPLQRPNIHGIPTIPPPLNPDQPSDPGALERQRELLERCRNHLLSYVLEQERIVRDWQDFSQAQSRRKEFIDDDSAVLADERAGFNNELTRLQQDQETLQQDQETLFNDRQAVDTERERVERVSVRLEQERRSVSTLRDQNLALQANLEERNSQIQEAEEAIRPLVRDIRSAYIHIDQAHTFLSDVPQRLEQFDN